jgi:uncharacterized protein YidB (DUF937 family)
LSTSDQPGEVVFTPPDAVLQNPPTGASFALDDDDANNPAANVAGGGDTSQPFRIEGGKVQFGDKEFDLSEFQGIVEKGVNASEANKAATAKFQEAAQLREQLQTEMAQYGQLKAVAEDLATLPEEAQMAVFQFADAVQKQVQAGVFTPGALPLAESAAVNVPYAVPQDFKPHERLKNFTELTDEGQAIVAALMPTIHQLAADNKRLNQQVQQVGKVLPEVTRFVGDSKATQQQAAAIAAIQGEYGRQVTVGELAKAMQDTGIPNPHAAWVFANRNSLAGGTAPNSPDSRPEFFDTKGLSTDEIARRVAAGQKIRG